MLTEDPLGEYPCIVQGKYTALREYVRHALYCSDTSGLQPHFSLVRALELLLLPCFSLATGVLNAVVPRTPSSVINYVLTFCDLPFPYGTFCRYLKAHGVPVAIAKTGVKFVHHEAEKYDVGVYFEANGHGTVLFKDKVLVRLTNMQEVSAAVFANGV